MEQRTTVLHEAPGRLADTLADLAHACGDVRRVAVVRELTKLHEQVWRGTLGAARDHFAAHEARGEVVVVVGGAPAPRGASDDDVVAVLTPMLAGGATVRDAADQVADSLGLPRRRVYDLALATKRNAAS